MWNLKAATRPIAVPRELEALPVTKIERLSARIWKDPIFWFVIALGLADGSVRNFVPATFPIFHREMGASLAQMGKTQFLFYLSSLIFGVVGGPLLAFAGLKRAAVGALAIACGSLLLIGFTQSFTVVLLAAGLLGLGIVAIVVIISSLVSGHFGARRQSVFLLSGLSDAGGSMIGPAILGWWIGHAHGWDLTWRSGYFVGALVLGGLILWTCLVRPENMHGDKPAESARPRGLANTRAVLRDAAFYTAVALCFCHGLAQAGMASFVGQLYVSKLNIDAGRAAYLLSIEAVGILAGRLIFGAVLSRWRIPELLVIAMCAAVETLAFLATIVSESYLGGAAMLLVGGFFMSAIGPSLNSYLGGRLAARVATAFALFAGLGNVGAALGPYLIGMLGTEFGIERAILFAPLFSALLSALALIRHLQKRNLVQPA
jgi:MFS family permease